MEQDDPYRLERAKPKDEARKGGAEIEGSPKPSEGRGEGEMNGRRMKGSTQVQGPRTHKSVTVTTYRAPAQHPPQHKHTHNAKL